MTRALNSRIRLLGRAMALAMLLVTPAALAEEDPDYPHGEFEDDCSLCHSDEGWQPAVISSEFDHAERGFPLQQSHSRVKCRQCHTTLEFPRADPECVSCHEDIHRGELGIDCGRCHTPRNFIDRIRMVKNHVATRFPLNGTHLTIDCEECHVPGPQGSMQFVNTPWRCQDCHLDRYLATNDPNHQDAGFPRECDLCHNTRAWEQGYFNHGMLPPGAECRDCHLDDYLATDDPNHQDNGFPQDCQLCHNTRSWEPANFDHDALPPGTDCANCHIDDYLGTDDPDHQAAGFPQDCLQCHSTRSWEPASFREHDQLYFPIYSGQHRNDWNDCGDCHVSQGNFSTFNCLQCHAHDDPSDLAGEHGGVSGYLYDSQACYSCHPDGRER